MAKYSVKYWESVEYEVEVEAADEDAALDKACAVLLGSVDDEAAIRLVVPEGMRIQCEVLEADWSVS